MTQVRNSVLFAAYFLSAALMPLPALGQPRDGAMQATSANAEEVIKGWKEKPQKVAREMMNRYGMPQEVTAQRLIWHNNGPWKRTELINEEIDHKFPMPHKDMLLQVIDYKVPADKFDDLAVYDGSVIVERTRGEIGARCDKEAANFLALNLAHDIVTGKRSVADARKTYAEQIAAPAEGKSAPLMQQLNFQSQPGTGDPDQTTLNEATVKKVKELMKAQEKGQEQKK